MKVIRVETTSAAIVKRPPEELPTGGQGYEFIDTDGIIVKDEYHTMDELYDHRRALNIALFNALNELYGRAGMHMFVPKVFKSKNHHPDCDPMFPGYFIVFAVGKDGQWTSYHYELKYWDHFKIREAPHSLNYPINHEDAVFFFENLHWKVE